MKLKEWLKKFDWILFFYITGFTAGLIVTFNADYKFTVGLMSFIGIASVYIFLSIFRDREISGRPYNKKEILKMIDEAPDVDYVGEYLKEKLMEDEE